MTTQQRQRWLAASSVAALALMATITSIGHEFTYDDRGMIFENPAVHALRHIPRLFAETYWPMKYGGDGYRPVVTTIFALQWAASHGHPWMFHLGNVILAVAAAVAVWWCAAAVLPPLGAWVAGALFAVHPVHVEVTGNIVGQSELLVALSLTLSTGLYIRRRQQNALRRRDAATIAALFLVGLLSKEHAIVLPALLAAAEFTVIPARRVADRFGPVQRELALAVVAIALAYLAVRGAVARDLAGFRPFPVFESLNMHPLDRIGTMLNEFPRIGQLLVFPTRLSADYSPAEVLVANGPGLSQLPGLFILLGAPLLMLLLRRRQPAASFGLLWLILAFLPVSNLLVAAGFITAERTLFTPSVGVVIVAGAIAAHVAATARLSRRRLGAATLAVLVLLGLGRSISRQRVWRSNATLFQSLLVDAPRGYRSHFMYARFVGLQGDIVKMEKEYRLAIRIFPYDVGMTLAVADAYTRAGLWKPAADLFEWSYQVMPESTQGRYEYVYCLARMNRWSDARREAFRGLTIAPPRDSRLLRLAIHASDKALRAGEH